MLELKAHALADGVDCMGCQFVLCQSGVDKPRPEFCGLFYKIVEVFIICAVDYLRHISCV